MDLGLTRKHIQKLAVDELSVVLYIRLLLNVPVAAVSSFFLAMLIHVWLPEEGKEATGMIILWLMLVLYSGWLVSTLLVIRQELLKRERKSLIHTPTFLSWAKAAHVFALISLARPWLKNWFPIEGLEWVTGMSWVLSCLMAGFYFIYMILLMLVKQLPPFVIVRAFLLAVAAASVPPSSAMR